MQHQKKQDLTSASIYKETMSQVGYLEASVSGIDQNAIMNPYPKENRFGIYEVTMFYRLETLQMFQDLKTLVFSYRRT